MHGSAGLNMFLHYFKEPILDFVVNWVRTPNKLQLTRFVLYKSMI